MTLAQFRLIYGKPGLEALARACGLRVGYLTQLSYDRAKEPSLTVAYRLHVASGGKLDPLMLRRRAAAEAPVPVVIDEKGALCAA